MKQGQAIGKTITDVLNPSLKRGRDPQAVLLFDQRFNIDVEEVDHVGEADFNLRSLSIICRNEPQHFTLFLARSGAWYKERAK
jgi:hypothetical protein